MSAAIIALALGTLLAIGALAFVLYPLFFDAPSAGHTRPRSSVNGDDLAVAALREIQEDQERLAAGEEIPRSTPRRKKSATSEVLP